MNGFGLRPLWIELLLLLTLCLTGLGLCAELLNAMYNMPTKMIGAY